MEHFWGPEERAEGKAWHSEPEFSVNKYTCYQRLQHTEKLLFYINCSQQWLLTATKGYCLQVQVKQILLGSLISISPQCSSIYSVLIQPRLSFCVLFHYLFPFFCCWHLSPPSLSSPILESYYLAFSIHINLVLSQSSFSPIYPVPVQPSLSFCVFCHYLFPWRSSYQGLA